MWYPQIKGMPSPCLPLSGGLNAAEARTAILYPKVGTTHWGWGATRQKKPHRTTTAVPVRVCSDCLIDKDTIFFNLLLFQCLLEGAELVSSLMWNWWFKCYTIRHKIWRISYIVSSGWVAKTQILQVRKWVLLVWQSKAFGKTTTCNLSEGRPPAKRAHDSSGTSWKNSGWWCVLAESSCYLKGHLK